MPPSIQRQKPAGNSTVHKKAQSTLDRLPSGWDVTDGIKVLVYGKSGSGKTTFAAKFPGPILWLLCSGGQQPGELRSIDTPENRKKITPRVLGRSDDMLELLREEGGSFNTIILDHVSGYQDLVLKEELGLDEVPVQKAWGTASQQTWGTVSLRCKEALRTLLSFSGNVVINAQERVFNSGDEGAQRSDLIAPTVGAGLTPSLAGWLNTAVDYICQTFIKPRESVEVRKLAGQESVKKVRVPGKVDYCLRVGPSDVFTTKFRTPHREKELPEYVTPYDYDVFMSLVDGSYGKK